MSLRWKTPFETWQPLATNESGQLRTVHPEIQENRILVYDPSIPKDDCSVLLFSPWGGGGIASADIGGLEIVFNSGAAGLESIGGTTPNNIGGTYEVEHYTEVISPATGNEPVVPPSGVMDSAYTGACGRCSQRAGNALIDGDGSFIPAVGPTINVSVGRVDRMCYQTGTGINQIYVSTAVTISYQVGALSRVWMQAKLDGFVNLTAGSNPTIPYVIPLIPEVKLFGGRAVTSATWATVPLSSIATFPSNVTVQISSGVPTE